MLLGGSRGLSARLPLLLRPERDGPDFLLVTANLNAMPRRTARVLPGRGLRIPGSVPWFLDATVSIIMLFTTDILVD